jgi:hypothetical protein
MYVLNSKESKRQYPKRLQMFLDFISIRSDFIEETCNLFCETMGEKKNSVS